MNKYFCSSIIDFQIKNGTSSNIVFYSKGKEDNGSRKEYFIPPVLTGIDFDLDIHFKNHYTNRIREVSIHRRMKLEKIGLQQYIPILQKHFITLLPIIQKYDLKVETFFNSIELRLLEPHLVEINHPYLIYLRILIKKTNIYIDNEGSWFSERAISYKDKITWFDSIHPLDFEIEGVYRRLMRLSVLIKDNFPILLKTNLGEVFYTLIDEEYVFDPYLNEFSNIHDEIIRQLTFYIDRNITFFHNEKSKERLLRELKSVEYRVEFQQHLIDLFKNQLASKEVKELTHKTIGRPHKLKQSDFEDEKEMMDSFQVEDDEEKYTEWNNFISQNNYH